MKCRRSLKKNIITYFVIICVVLVTGYSVFLSFYFTRGLDLSVQFRLEEKALLYLENYAQNPESAKLAENKRINVYDEYAQLPEGIRTAFTVDELEPGAFLSCSVEPLHYRIYTVERPDQKKYSSPSITVREKYPNRRTGALSSTISTPRLWLASPP